MIWFFGGGGWILGVNWVWKILWGWGISEVWLLLFYIDLY